MAVDWLAIGRRVQKERMKHGWTQDEFAEICGFAGRGYISRVENGKAVYGVKTLFAMAEKLGISPAYLLDASVPADTPFGWPELAEQAKELDTEQKKMVTWFIEGLTDHDRKLQKRLLSDDAGF
ncbi:MAG: helix-turn-helix domain-containing protein [Oscillospiraceae bacterium]